MKLSTLSETLKTVDAIRCLTESKGPLGHALGALATAIGGKTKWALVGGLATSFHSNPRSTQDVDIIVSGENDLDLFRSVPGFKLTRPHALTHLDTGVEVEILTPEFVKVDPKIFELALATATDHNGVPVVSRESLAALKLQRASYQDKADILSIIKTGGALNLEKFPLTDKQKAIYQEIEQAAAEKGLTDE